MTQLQQPSAGIVQQWFNRHPSSGVVQQWLTQKEDDGGPKRHPNRNPPPNDDPPPPPKPPGPPVEVPDPPRPVIRPDRRQARMPEHAPLEVPLGSNDRVRLPQTTDVPVPEHYRNPEDPGATA